ncbi:MAG TPA: hypothetical protein VNH15_03745 [Elusimicrobiota bacterium]|nr:hypothetical protein [Elusimicrobiota bacterium]
MKCRLLAATIIFFAPHFSRAWADSIIKPADYEVGAPPLFSINISSNDFGDIPGWYGDLFVDAATHSGHQPHLFGIHHISDLALSTAAVVSDLIPSRRCLWIVYRYYGWADPHTGGTCGVLLLVNGRKLTPVLKVPLDEIGGGAGEGYKETVSYIFSRFTDKAPKDYTPNVRITNEVWATTQEELEHPGPKPLSTSQSIYTFNGKQFVDGSGDPSPGCETQ